MGKTWYFQTLGLLRGKFNDKVVERFHTQKAAALLGYLILHEQRVHPREELLEVFWPEVDPAESRLKLNNSMWSLRRQFEPPGVPRGAVFVCDRYTVRLNELTFESDIRLFQSYLDRANAASSVLQKRELLAEAVALYRGEFLPGFYDEWVQVARQRFFDAYLDALRQIASTCQEVSDNEGAVSALRRLIVGNPLEEEAYTRLMHIYLERGQPSATLKLFRELELVLEHQLGELPGEPAQKLAREASQVKLEAPSNASLLHEQFNPSLADFSTALPFSSRKRTVGAIPLQITKFFGREGDLKRLRDLFVQGKQRLVTVTGPGGSGKTRLSIELAHELKEHFQGAIWLVSLADHAHARFIPDAVLKAFGLQGNEGDYIERLRTVIENRESSNGVLLILDNFEHLVELGGTYVLGMLSHIEGLHVLVTSRQRLNLAGEVEHYLLPLEVPAVTGATQTYTPQGLMSFPCVQMFVDRAQQIRPYFQLTSRNTEVVAELCRRLEGMPLAVELSATLVQVFSPQQMLSQLSRRFDLLVAKNRNLPERHRSLRAVLEYSYQQLSPPLQVLFRAISVFRGCFTPDAVFSVVLANQQHRVEPQGDSKDLGPNQIEVLNGLGQLRDRSLIQYDESPTRAGETEVRFKMLETLREYANDLLSPEERNTYCDRHAAYFESLAAEAENRLRGARQVEWFGRIQANHGSIRAALDWTIQPAKVSVAFHICNSLLRFWVVQGHSEEGENWLTRAFAHAEFASSEDVISGKTTLATLKSFMHKHDEAQALFEEVLSHVNEDREPKAYALALFGLGVARLRVGETLESIEKLRKAQEMYEKLGMEIEQAGALIGIGVGYNSLGFNEEAIDALTKALSLFSKHNEYKGIALAETTLASYDMKDYPERARQRLTKAYEIYKALDDSETIYACYTRMARLEQAAGRFEEAERLLMEGLKRMIESGNTSRLALLANLLAGLEFERGNHRLAAYYYGVCRKAAEWYRDGMFKPDFLNMTYEKLVSRAVERITAEGLRDCELRTPFELANDIYTSQQSCSKHAS